MKIFTPFYFFFFPIGIMDINGFLCVEKIMLVVYWCIQNFKQHFISFICHKMKDGIFRIKI